MSVVELDRSNFSGAGPHFLAALKLDPEMSDAYYNLGMALTEEKEFHAAKSSFQAVLTRQPEDAFALNSLSVMTAAEKNFTEAERYFRKAVDCAPGFEEAGNKLAKSSQRDERHAVMSKLLCYLCNVPRCLLGNVMIQKCTHPRRFV